MKHNSSYNLNDETLAVETTTDSSQNGQNGQTGRNRLGKFVYNVGPFALGTLALGGFMTLMITRSNGDIAADEQWKQVRADVTAAAFEDGFSAIVPEHQPYDTCGRMGCFEQDREELSRVDMELDLGNCILPVTVETTLDNRDRITDVGVYTVEAHTGKLVFDTQQELEDLTHGSPCDVVFAEEPLSQLNSN